MCGGGVPNGECGREISGVTEAEHSITSHSKQLPEIKAWLPFLGTGSTELFVVKIMGGA